jgi:hypothetical protein
VASHQSSASTYNETRKESRFTMWHRLWEKVRYQSKVSAPYSSSPAVTRQSSYGNGSVVAASYSGTSRSFDRRDRQATEAPIS